MIRNVESLEEEGIRSVAARPEPIRRRQGDLTRSLTSQEAPSGRRQRGREGADRARRGSQERRRPPRHRKDDAWKANIQRVEKEAKQLKRKRDSGDKKIAFNFGDSEENRAYEMLKEHASKKSRLQLEEKTLAEMKEKVDAGKTRQAP